MIEIENQRLYRHCFLVSIFMTLGVSIADPFISLYAMSVGATGSQIAWIFAGFAVAKTLLSPISGSLSDSKGRKPFIVGGILLHLITSSAYLLAPGPVALIFLRVIQGFGVALVKPVLFASVGGITPARREGITMGTFDISVYGAMAFGPLLGGCVNHLAGFTGVFLSFSILCFFSLAAVLLFFKDDRGERNGGYGVRIDMSVLKRSRMLLGLCVFIFCRFCGIVVSVVFLPIWARISLGLNGMEIGALMAAPTASMALLLHPMGRIVDTARPFGLVILGGSVAAILTSCLPLARTFPQLLAVCIGIGVFSAVSLPASSALLVREGRTHGMGLCAGLFNGAMNLAGVVAPLLGGILLDGPGIKFLFYGAGLAGVAGTAFFLLWPYVVSSRGNKRISLFQKGASVGDHLKKRSLVAEDQECIFG